MIKGKNTFIICLKKKQQTQGGCAQQVLYQSTINQTKAHTGNYHTNTVHQSIHLRCQKRIWIRGLPNMILGIFSPCC